MGFFDAFFKPDIAKFKINKNIKGLIKALSYKEPSIRIEAAIALGEIGPEFAIKPIVDASNDDDVNLMKEALHSIENIKKRVKLEKTNILINKLKDKDAKNRIDAGIALDSIGYRPDKLEDQIVYFSASQKWDDLLKIGLSAYDALRDAIITNNESIRKEILKVLIKKEGPLSVDLMLNYLKDSDIKIKHTVINVLGETKLPDNFDKVTKELIYIIKNDKDINMRRFATFALKKMRSTINDIITKSGNIDKKTKDLLDVIDGIEDDRNREIARLEEQRLIRVREEEEKRKTEAEVEYINVYYAFEPDEMKYKDLQNYRLSKFCRPS